MNIKHLIVVAAVFASGSVLAQDAAPQKQAGKTRAEVYAELKRDYEAGINANNRTPEFFDVTQVASSRSRDEVRAEAAQTVKPAPRTSSGS